MPRFVLTLLLILVLPSLAVAQDYPVRPITLVAGFAAGEPGDAAARILARFAPAALGQPLTVENAPGDGGIAAMGKMLTSAPDGYTLALCGMDTLTLQPRQIVTPLGSPRQYTAVATVAESPLCLAVRTDAPFKSANDFLAEAGKRPGALSVGDAGKGSAPQLAALLLASKAQKRWKQVHFDTAAASAEALVQGKVDALVQHAATVLPLVKSGKARVLAVFSERPAACLPGVPTLHSQGNGLMLACYLAVLGPSGMVPADVTKLNASFKSTLADADCAKALREAGFEPLYEGPNFIASRLRRDYENNVIFTDVLRDN